ncbi:MAG TPA: TIM-barrel domain-containing protein [Terracidiphilus sp.]|jgi:hypothetical protein
MPTLNRRTFVQLSSGAALGAASSRAFGFSHAPSLSSQDGVVRVTDSNYSWEYSQSDDTFRLRDSMHRLIVSGKLQPAVVVAPADEPALRQCSAGKPSAPRLEQGRVTVNYDGVNGAGRLAVTWRFDEHGIWTEPIVYDAPTAQDVVSLHYFADVNGGNPAATLHSTYFVVPGISEASTVSPIVRDDVGLDEDVWLGRGSSSPGPSQQWGLPVHYFCGFSVSAAGGAMRNMFTEQRSGAFTCGLTDLPGGDLFLQLKGGESSLWIDYRSDLWKHLRGPGPISLGATLYWSVAPDYYQAIAGYYQGLLHAGIIHKAQPSAKKISTALTPQFCTWGSQVDRNKANAHLDEAYLNEIYEELKASGMKARMFSIDDKWEGNYGNLQHSAERLPHFEQFIDRLRTDGYKLGVWAALMRCEHPESLGLTTDNMLKRPDGTPFAVVNHEGRTQYYILDFTQPEVAKVLEDIARKFIRRYKPDLVKFDFGYEMPAVATAGPRDKQWSGERLMWKGLDVLIKAMRKENPDLVVMYYQLSPLFLDYFDLYSPDDLFENSGEFDLEANRRFFFSSLLGQLGIPTYSSSGYDWASTSNIWFDAAALGTIGSMNDFRGDEQGESSTPELIARYNGLTHAVRPTNTFEILPLDYLLEAPTLGAHPRSWARLEAGQLVLLAFRPPVAWDPQPLARQTDDPRVKDAIHCGVPVVVASRTAESIAVSASLAIVPYGGGEIVVRRKFGKKAEIISHYFGGGSGIKSESMIENDELKVTALERNQAGLPLEWIEVNIS